MKKIALSIAASLLIVGVSAGAASATESSSAEDEYSTMTTIWF